MSRIIARRPRGLWSAPVQVDFAEIFVGLVKGGAATYLGSPGSAAGSVIDALRKTKLKVKRDAGELAWMLTVTALADAIRGAASSLDRRIDVADLAAFVDAVALFAGEHEWPLDPTFFTQPSRLPIVHDIAENFASWLTKRGIDARIVRTARRDVIDSFAGAIDTAWRDNEPVWEPIRETLGVPFVQAKRDSAAWRAYHDSLMQLPDTPVFDDTFSLRDIYIPLRGSLRRESEQRPDPSMPRIITGTVFFTRLDALSERPIDEDVTAPGHVTWSAGVRQPLFQTMELVVGVDDILDAYDPVFGPKPGRTLTLGVRVWE